MQNSVHKGVPLIAVKDPGHTSRNLDMYAREAFLSRYVWFAVLWCLLLGAILSFPKSAKNFPQKDSNQRLQYWESIALTTRLPRRWQQVHKEATCTEQCVTSLNSLQNSVHKRVPLMSKCSFIAIDVFMCSQTSPNLPLRYISQ